MPTPENQLLRLHELRILQPHTASCLLSFWGICSACLSLLIDPYFYFCFPVCLVRNWEIMSQRNPNPSSGNRERWPWEALQCVEWAVEISYMVFHGFDACENYKNTFYLTNFNGFLLLSLLSFSGLLHIMLHQVLIENKLTYHFMVFVLKVCL